ncbi:MAG: hypothetical protein ACRC5H_10840, partial [Treponemataceae bacterium]
MAVVNKENQSLTESSKNEQLENKKELKQIENLLNHDAFSLYSKGFILFPFKQFLEMLISALKQLQSTTNNIFEKTSNSDENLYLDMLIQTGLSPIEKNFIKKISFFERTEELIMHNFSVSILDTQQSYLDSILLELTSSKELIEIEAVIFEMQKLHVLASYNFSKVMRVFSNYNNEDSDATVTINALESFLNDYYTMIYNFNPTAALARALCAVETLKKNRQLSSPEKDAIILALTTVYSVIKKIISSNLVKNMLCLIQQNSSFEPQVNEGSSQFIDNFIERLKSNFIIDTSKIKEKILENQFAGDVKALFEGKQIQEVGFYNKQNSNFLIQKKLPNFLYIRAMQLLKTFATFFLSEQKTEILKKL